MVLSRIVAVTGLLVLAVFCTGLVSSCTVANPLYTPAGDAGLAGPQDASVDLAVATTTGDLAVKPGADLAQPTKCTNGDRACAQMISLVCQGGVLQPDRVCPSNTACAGGYCQAPPLANNGVGKNCDITGDPSESLCITGGGSTPSCTPFVDPASMGQGLIWRCAKAVGSGVPGTICSAGKQCRSGFCGSNGTCFRACAGTADCPMSGNGSFKCEVVEILVEGVVAQAQSCVPL